MERTMSIHMDDEIRQKLRYMAQYYGRSSNGQVLHYIQNAVTAYEKENGPIPVAPKTDKEYM